MRLTGFLLLLLAGCALHGPPNTQGKPVVTTTSDPELPPPLESLVEPSDFAGPARSSRLTIGTSTTRLASTDMMPRPASIPGKVVESTPKPAPRQDESTQPLLRRIQPNPANSTHPPTTRPSNSSAPEQFQRQLEEAFHAAPSSSRVLPLRQLVEFYLLRDDPLQARKLLEEHVDLVPPDDYEFRLLRARIHRRLGDNAAAFKELERLTESESRFQPLAIQNATFFEGALIDVGRFRPRQNSTYRPGDIAQLYYELLHYSLRSDGKAYHLALTLHFDLVHPDGRVVPLPGLATERIEVSYRGPKKDIALGSGIPIPSNIPPGKYRLRVTVIDQNKVRLARTSREIPFELK